MMTDPPWGDGNLLHGIGLPGYMSGMPTVPVREPPATCRSYSFSRSVTTIRNNMTSRKGTNTTSFPGAASGGPLGSTDIHLADSWNYI